LSGLQAKYLKISFLTVQNLLSVRSELMPLIKKNRERANLQDVYE